MPCLSVYAQAHPQQPMKVLGRPEHVASTLAEFGVRYAQHEPVEPVGHSPSDEQLLAAYQPVLKPWLDEAGEQLIKVVRSVAGQVLTDAPHAHCLDEHSHNEDEVHLFVAGQALIGLHAAGMVYELICEKGDLLVIPAGTLHWFDGGEPAHWVTIRLLGGVQESCVRLSGDPIASVFSRLDA